MKPVRCLCHVVLLPQEGNSVNCDQAFFFFSGEKKSANAILRASEEGRVIAWGTHNPALVMLSCYFSNSISLFF